MDVIYDIKDESVFDGMVSKLGEMTVEEQLRFMLMMKAYQAGIMVGQRIAEGRQGEPA